MRGSVRGFRRRLRQMLDVPGSASFEMFRPLANEALRLRVHLHETEGVGLPGTSELVSTDWAGARGLAFASEASFRALGTIPHPEQLMAALALLQGKAVELDTGEGKTLAGAIAAACMVRQGRTVQIISANDYLAARDAAWMSGLYESLGISVGYIDATSSHEHRRQMYARDVTYVSVSELGYDVLRDRFVYGLAEALNPRFDAAIVDEADAVMIDEAMSPLVLAGEESGDPATEDRTIVELVDSLVAGVDFEIDGDGATASYTERGLDRLEEALGGVNLFEIENAATLTRLNLALHARALVRRDVDYIIRDGSLHLVSSTRGRVAEHQRWPDGLHTAVEAKEGILNSGQGTILDTLTVHELLSRFDLVAGMSGTVIDVAEDFLELYGLASGRIERHLPSRRIDSPPRVYSSQEGTYAAAISEILRVHENRQPVLVGTQSVAESEHVARLLADRGVQARILNAKNDGAEAEVIARAGEIDAVTISTQISGRGTDIPLGGIDAHDHDRVADLGGLAIIAIGRFPSARLDAQLRGRSGRQGDPGSYSCFSSLEDELVRYNAPDYFLLANKAEVARYSPRQRRAVVDAAQRVSDSMRLERHRSTWAMNRALSAQRAKVLEFRTRALDADEAMSILSAQVPVEQQQRMGVRCGDAWGPIASSILVDELDHMWQEHLAAMQEVRDGIHLRALAGENPIDAFHLAVLEEFDGWLGHAVDSAVDVLLSLPPERSPDISVYRPRSRPSATWTYMISENPFSDPIGRAIARHRRGRAASAQ